MVRGGDINLLQIDCRYEIDGLFGSGLDIAFERLGVADCAIRVVDLGLNNVAVFVDVFGDVEYGKSHGDFNEHGGIGHVDTGADPTAESEGNRRRVFLWVLTEESFGIEFSGIGVNGRVVEDVPDVDDYSRSLGNGVTFIDIVLSGGMGYTCGMAIQRTWLGPRTGQR